MNDALDFSRDLPMTIFLSGIFMATFAASGLFFLKFWRKTGEPFFFAFAVACWMIALERIPLLFYGQTNESRYWVYLFRMSAFIFIILAILRANRSRRRP